MSEELPPSQDLREQQATACLLAAEKYRDLLLRLARKLAGSEESGMDLYQQTVLNCHDTIQRWGFVGEDYHFYLYKALGYLAQREQRQARRFVPLTDWQIGTTLEAELSDDATAYGGVLSQQRRMMGLVEASEPPTDARAQLAEQMQEEIRLQFSPADRLALRLHVDGESYRDIAALVGGGDHSWISRRVNRMKDVLRETFAQAWAALNE